MIHLPLPPFRHLPGLAIAALFTATAPAAPLIHEIMYHPPSSLGSPEDVTAEWIELHNPDPANAIDVSNWKFSKGIAFTLPVPTVIPAGGFLVVAAQVAKFQADHPGFAGAVTGGWVGTLASGGEQLQLDDALGFKVCDVTYADEGDWGLRARGPLSFGHRGWIWETAADGGGNTIELRNPVLGAGSGQNWAVSAAPGGTPGAGNSTASANLAPLIKGAQHKPEIPRSTDPIRFSCSIEDELPGASATLNWRVNGAASFTAVPMLDADADGDLDAQIPPQANLSVIEWYVSASDGSTARTWPAPARVSNPGVLPPAFGQVTNGLLQVDDSFSPARDFTAAGNQPVLRLVMTAAERTELNTLQTTSGEEQSEAAFNATLVSHEGTGTKVVYNSSVRNRGFGSALGPPNNFHVAFRSDDPWKGRSSIQLNCQYGYSQALGNVLFARAGVAPQDTVLLQLRVNGADPAESGSRMYGRYAMLEGRGGDWAKKHYPLDPDGNFYRADDHAPGSIGVPPGNLASGEFQYEGTNGAAYSDTFIKETNKDANDYSDLVNLTRVVSAPATGGSAAQPAISDAAFPASVATVLEVDQFYRFIACDALIGNQEGSLQSGRADDFSLYRGVVDPRFRFIPHDMDDVFDIGAGAGNPVTRSIFSYDELVQQGNTGVAGLRRLFNHPALLPRYYATLLDSLNTWFDHATIDPIIDQLYHGWVPATDGSAATPNRGIAEIKAFIDARRANVLSQIQQNYSLTVTGNSADSTEGYKVTTNGAATMGGTFHVARTYSVTVNGKAAQWFYRTTGGDAAGTWKMTVPAGGGSVLRPGLNKVVVRFWDGLDGTGQVVREFAADVLWNAAPGTTINGTLTAPGSVALLAPESYVPGVPLLVRVDLRDGSGGLNRAAWNTTVNLTANNGVVLTPNTLTLTNGMGSALLTTGSTTGGGAVNYFSYGTGGTGTTAANSGSPGGTWKYRSDFTSLTLPAFITSDGNTWRHEAYNDSTWPAMVSHTGYGDSDENRAFTRVDYNAGTAGTQSAPAYLFRSTFTIPDLTQLSALTGQVKYDDAAIVYVNGTEVLRTTGFDTSANLPQVPLTSYSDFGGAATFENATAALTVPLGLVHNGVNTIAVEIHQHDAGSSDVSFDLRLAGTLVSTTNDPGNFSLTATAGSLSASKTLTSLGAAAGTTVSGTLPPGVTTWSGVMRVTGDLTVPAGATLNIAPGTHVLLTGTSGAGSTAGTDLIVTGGTVTASGTAAQPISITAADAATRWGEINTGGSTTTWNYCLVSRGCHSPGGGHTGTGPCFRLANGAVWTFDDGVIADLPGKILTNTGNTTMTLRRSQFARCVMGPETDGSTLTIEDSNFTDMLPLYRESGAPDDEDNIYIHDSGGRPVNLRRSVFANSGDDGIDCLAGSLTVEDCIIRNILDKGMSLLQNNAMVRRTQIIDCDFGISTKTQTGAEATPYTLTLENCTIAGEAHPANQSDQSGGVYWHNVGIHVRNKYGTGPNPQLFVNASNCIISAITPMLNDYATPGVDHPLTTVSYQCYQDAAGSNPVDPAPPSGTGTLNADPRFLNPAGRDFHLAAGSPCINTGDPALLDPDNSRSDIGALPAGTAAAAGGIHWTLAGNPYRVTANTTVPAGATLRIDPGVNVQFAENVRLTVNGRLMAEGTPDSRITFSHVPGTHSLTDVDPIKNLTQTGAPKWGGIRIVDSMAGENVVKYADFINAQGTSPAGTENQGSLGFIRSWGFCEGLTFSGTHLRMLFGRNPKLTVVRCLFPDLMIFDPALGRIEDNTDFLTAADNSMEPLKVEYPVEAATTGAAWSANGLPLGGWWRVYYNEFHGNRGHNDVFDADSGRANVAGDFLLDCRYNHFYGLSGDEHIDLGGDAYIASNIFEAATKDPWVSAFGTDNGYSNAISSGDKGDGTTIMVVRNTCYDLDHVINCKARTATIFEHNTVSAIHPDYTYTESTPDQQVKCAPVNFFVPEDGTNPTRGDGAYLGFNIISNSPRLFSGPDARKINGTTIVNDVTTEIDFFHNLLDQIGDPEVGPNHPGGLFGGTFGPNEAGAPGFVDPAGEDYALRMDSLARGTAPGGLAYGASIPEWAYVLGGPSGTTADTSATFTIGGPGLVAYKYRVDGGTWSAERVIGTGPIFPRGATVTSRQATLVLTGLSAGPHTLEVLGRDMAGNWQDNDPARTITGEPQAPPSARSWTVDTLLPIIALSEVCADPSQQVELTSRSASPTDLAGWSLSDSLLTPGEQSLSGTIAPGALLTVNLVNFQLDNDGDEVFLFDASNTLRDSIVFGPLPAGYSLARTGAPAAWTLVLPSIGQQAKTAARLSDASQVVINEWLSSGGIRYREDWIELANPAAFPASLSGMSLTDTRFGARPVFPPLSFIGGYGFVKLIADGNPAAGANHTSFRMDGLTGELLLFAADGRGQDNVRYFPQVEDVSQGLVTSGGTGGFGFFTLATGGLANGTGDPAYPNSLALLNSLRITEIMYQPAGGNSFEFIELTNTGATTLQLGGVVFYDGIDFTFPPGFTLAPGAQTVLVRDLASFQSRYGSGLNVAGQYLGALDNNGEALALRLPHPWDANILYFRYENTWQAANGTGLSLVLASHNTGFHLFDEPGTWTTGPVGGTPAGGSLPASDLASWIAGNSLSMADLLRDGDLDGLSNLVEYAFSTNPASASGSDGSFSAPTAQSTTLAGAPAIALNAALPVSALPGGFGRPDIIYYVEDSADLAVWRDVLRKSPTDPAWQQLAGALPLVESLGTSGDRARFLLKSPETIPSTGHRHLRMKVVLVP